MKNDGNGPVYYHENGLGSAIALTSGSGNVVERYTYDAYGQPTITDAGGTSRYFSAYGNRMLFTGREWIRDARIYDYRNRTYSPAIGRFMETDPIGYEGGDVNLYRYVNNDPVNWLDPFGFCCEEEKAAVAHLEGELEGLVSELSSSTERLATATSVHAVAVAALATASGAATRACGIAPASPACVGAAIAAGIAAAAVDRAIQSLTQAQIAFDNLTGKISYTATELTKADIALEKCLAESQY